MLRKLLAGLAVYRHPKLVIILLLGFSSGLPIVLTFSTLSTWLSDAGVEKSAIGLFALVGVAYSFNFLWSPLVDHLKAPLLWRLGRRRGWILLTQLALVATIAGMGLTDPTEDPWLTALFALLVTFSSATQDIVVDAYRVEILAESQYAEGAAAGVFGYRVGMLVSGAGALFIADEAGWPVAYACMAAFIGVGIVAVLVAREPSGYERPRADGPVGQVLVQRAREALVAPFVDFMRRRGWWLVLIFVFFARMPDSFTGFMINPFLLEVGFTLSEIASIGKVYGFAATTIGTVIGALLIRNLGALRALWVCLVFQLTGNLVYIMQAISGADPLLLIVTISYDNLTTGMIIAVVIAFMMSLCNIKYTATQYALLSSLAGLARSVFAAGSGWAADTFGWVEFFLISAALGLPGLAVLALLPRYADVAFLRQPRREPRAPDDSAEAKAFD